MYPHYLSSGNTYKAKKILFYIFIGLCFLISSGCEDGLFVDRSKEPSYIFDSFWQEVDRNYSFFEQVPVNWDSVYQVYRGQVRDTTTPEELFRMFDEIRNLLNDAHTNVYAPMG